jgi:hypothetical protein
MRRSAWAVVQRTAHLTVQAYSTHRLPRCMLQVLRGSVLRGRTLGAIAARPRKPAQTRVADRSAAAATATAAATPAATAAAAATLTETRVLLRGLPADFTWREARGLASAFGVVRKVLLLQPPPPRPSPPRGAQQEGDSSSSSSSSSEAPSSASSPEVKATGGGRDGAVASEAGERAALVFMQQRSDAERLVQELDGRAVQGCILRARLYVDRRTGREVSSSSRGGDASKKRDEDGTGSGTAAAAS